MRIFLLTIFFFIFSSFAESKSYEDTKRYKKDLAKISKHNAFRDNNWEQCGQLGVTIGGTFEQQQQAILDTVNFFNKYLK